MLDSHKFIITLNVANYCNYPLTKLTRRSVLYKWFSNILTLLALYIPFAAKAQTTEWHLLHQKEEYKVWKKFPNPLDAFWYQQLIKRKAGNETILNVTVNTSENNLGS
jgi:hypothetical protein